MSQFKRENLHAMKPATINNRLNVLKAVAKFAWRTKQWIPENLSARISLLQPHNEREVFLTAQQVRMLIDACPQPQGKAWIAIAVYTGMRGGERYKLRPENVNGDNLRIRTGKTGKLRTIPIVPQLRPYLSALPFSASRYSLDNWFRNARTATNLGFVVPHDLRHTAASFLINAGVPLFVVGQILGHTVPKTTMRYSHLLDSTLSEAMKKMPVI